MCEPPSPWLLGGLRLLFLLPKDPFPKRLHDGEAAEPPVSLRVPAGTRCSRPPASRGLPASALLQPALVLEAAGLNVSVWVFFSLLGFLLLLLLQKELGSRNVCKRQRDLPVHLCEGPVPAHQGTCANSPFFYFSALFQRKRLHSLLSANAAATARSAQLSRVS